MKAQPAYPIEINIPPFTVNLLQYSNLENPEMNAREFPSHTYSLAFQTGILPNTLVLWIP
jgi:hypothetical protein